MYHFLHNRERKKPPRRSVLNRWGKRRCSVGEPMRFNIFLFEPTIISMTKNGMKIGVVQHVSV
ncbi:hypothetical protein B4114_2428 [Geobacillus stearothermophilus]|uniref:Uncharacterized protein n=1 Tax=Geobacillus stearothermophilus TaxID=1422 RepID=A0A150NCB6_GEOSE|nr:hypothetical protein B4114_2428 [Geobacillus stearothermophilus]